MNFYVRDAINVAQASRLRGERVSASVMKNPELAIFQLQLEALKNSLNQKSTLIFDERTPPFSLFQNLPADSATK